MPPDRTILHIDMDVFYAAIAMHELCLTATVGVVFNEFLAKLASGLDKPDGLTVINHDNLDDVLLSLPVERLWGVGPATLTKMHHLNRTESKALVLHWPHAAELLIFHPRPHHHTGHHTRHHHGDARGGDDDRPLLKRYPKLDWCILADRWPEPRLYLSVRGGTIDAPHTHRDLLSFNLLRDGQPLITNAPVDEYLDTTFSPRRDELFEVSSQSKNTLLINGVGVAAGSSVLTETFANLARGEGELTGSPAVRLDASDAMGTMRDGPVAKRCLRLFVMLGGEAVLVLDRIVLPHPGRAEARLLSPAPVSVDDAHATVLGQRAALHGRFAANVPAHLHTALTAPTTPGPSRHMLRWCTNRLHTDMVLGTLLAAEEPAALTLHVDARIHIHARTGEHVHELCFDDELRPA